MPLPMGCFTLKWPWAVGSEDVVFPKGVGMPVGKSTKWVALQVHYYNPSLDAGVVDSSGVRLLVADEPREQDAAVFMLDGGATKGSRPALEPGLSNLSVPSFV